MVNPELLTTDGPLVAFLRQAFPRLMAVYVFGSQVQGHARPDSDLDLAVLVPGYVDPLALWDASQQVARLVDGDVDLLDFRAASTVMQHQILTSGKRLWAQDPDAGIYESFALTEKLRWDEARAGLLADIEKDGRVYGR